MSFTFPAQIEDPSLGFTENSRYEPTSTSPRHGLATWMSLTTSVLTETSFPILLAVSLAVVFVVHHFHVLYMSLLSNIVLWSRTGFHVILSDLSEKVLIGPSLDKLQSSYSFYPT